MLRRDLLQLGVALGASSLAATLGCTPDATLPPPAAPLAGAPPPPPAAPASASIVYFQRFGVDERMIREALEAALARGGDYADVFFQHRVSRNMSLEDGEVNRASASVDLGVGVRVVKGDQTGYGYT